MVHGLWQSAAGLQTQEYRQAILANNLANVDTPGFKPDRITFQERLNATQSEGATKVRHPALQALSGGLFESPVYTNYAQAGLETSQGPLDVAIAGYGFLTVRTSEGTRYTRDGRMLIDRNGTLLHAASGSPMVDDRGRSILLDRNAVNKITIDGEGNIQQAGEIVGKLALADFADRNQLNKTGGNLLDAGGMRPVPADGSLKQYAIEASGVDPVSSLVEMIEATRVYQMNATLISMQDESLSRVVNDVGRIG